MILKARSRRSRFNSDVGIGRNIHPTPTAGNGQLKEDGYYDCKQCGFENEAKLVVSPGGSRDGNGGVTVVSDEPTVGSGCAFCGSYNSR